MGRIAYINGAYRPHSEAAVHIEDRGFQFSDGIYEVCLVVNGALWDAEGHFARLERSLKELEIDQPLSTKALMKVVQNLLRRNRLENALVYIQVTRGVAPRDHAYGNSRFSPTVVMTAKRFDLAKTDKMAATGMSVISMEDIRWRRVDIKSVSLLPNVMAKQIAREQGAGEAWLVRDGVVTEGAASNAWIVREDGSLQCHPLGHDILGGITRATTIACAKELQIQVDETPFSLAEALEAKEAFITSATNLVMPVTRIDGHSVRDRKPGEVTLRLRDAYKRHCAQSSVLLRNRLQ